MGVFFISFLTSTSGDGYKDFLIIHRQKHYKKCKTYKRVLSSREKAIILKKAIICIVSLNVQNKNARKKMGKR